jgi:hypothetical protein
MQSKAGPNSQSSASKNYLMNKALSLALLVAGIILIIYGINASNSAGSSLSRMANGAPTDKTIYLLVGGTVAAIVGLFGMIRGSKTT